MDFGENLKRIRQNNNITQEDLAKRINTSRSNIANYENNNNMPSVDILVKLASVFHCSVDYLIGSKTEEKTIDDFSKKNNLELQKLLMVELPNLINRILHLSMIPLPASETIVNAYIEDIKKITNAECESALSYLKN